jgi:hypothetical protein
MQTFVDRQALWKTGGGMEMEVKEQTATSYVFNVTRCKYAEMYREMGLGEIGHLLSCQRFLPRVRQAAEADPHANDHAGRDPLRLRLQASRRRTAIVARNPSHLLYGSLWPLAAPASAIGWLIS